MNRHLETRRVGLTAAAFMLALGLFFGIIQAATLQAAPAWQAEPTEPAPEESGIYVVQPGDTVHAIAEQFGMTAAELRALNNMGDSNLIYVGEELAVSGTPVASEIISGTVTPAAEEEATPAAAEEATPAAEEEATPAAQEEATPAAEEEATPVAEEEATPAAEEEATPAAEEEATPAAAEEATPAAEEEATPAAEEEATPAAAEEATPAAEEEATPAAEEEATPAAAEEATPVAEEEATPAAEEEATPAAEEEATPAAEEEATPAAEEEATPAAEEEATPAAEEEATPAAEEEATPAAEEEATPAAEEEETPVAAEEATPAAEEEATPVAEEEATPAAEEEATPVAAEEAAEEAIGLRLASLVAGNAYHSPIAISGVPVESETDVRVRLVDSAGEVLAERIAAAGDEDFSTYLRFTVRARTAALLELTRAESGEELLTVPLTLLPGQSFIDMIAPVGGDVICGRVLILGYSSTAGGKVYGAAYAADGTLLTEGTGNGGAQGNYAPFYIGLDPAVEAETPGFVSAYAKDSISDATIDQAIVPVTFYPAGSDACQRGD